ncbi:hypothetical protein [Rhizobium sp. RU36D]|uniref:hypothetical protein n=1 Tax=Rhizobium sp. RU36D TaxID=1907415 RepID=UPI0009D79DE1|nr:hypothetical protein [Rhizobium sp. RU36D]SMD14981.1 hypothetical protein SAMN05880593_1278 [Rhizobium sp. RU36D]
MIAVLRHFRDYGPAYMAGLGVAFLISVDVLRASGLQWSDIAALAKQFIPDRNGREVKNYVEFTTVEAGALSVTTGVKFASSIEEGRITSQWCYVEPLVSQGATTLNLFLSTVEGRNRPKLVDFAPADLQPFGLTADDAQTLLKTYCRFQ